MHEVPNASQDKQFSVEGMIIDPLNNQIFPGRVNIQDGIIFGIERLNEIKPGCFITPGFVNTHVHIESGKMTPGEFARQVVTTGIVATVSDPHEIANVCGVAGIEWMIKEAKRTPLKINYGVPSCVPATNPEIETAGASLDAKIVAELIGQPEFLYLAEMMNYPGVLMNDPEVHAKLHAAIKAGKRIDGHAPGLIGEDIKRYAAAGISSDHECTTLEEARQKAQRDMLIQIREGSAAKNFESLFQIMAEYPKQVAFCTDDSEPQHITDQLQPHMRRLLARGFSPLDIYRAASVNPALHYGLNVGLLRVGDPADFNVINNAKSPHFEILKTYINGELVAQEGQSLLEYQPPLSIINNFHAQPITKEVLSVQRASDTIRVIGIIPGELISEELFEKTPNAKDGSVQSDTQRDILKLVCLNRYTDHAEPAIAFVKGLGLKRGAVASTVGHDCHNIIAAGCSDEEIARAINAVIKAKGGVCVVDGNEETVISLPIAGLMSDQNSESFIPAYRAVEEKACSLGSSLSSVFMALSFLPLSVIPDLKLTDKGLFKTSDFRHVSVFV